MGTMSELIAYVGQTMFERHLTDISGGNISAREGSRIYITPRYAGSKYHWHLKPEQVLSSELESDELLTHPEFSREGKAHLGILRTFPMVGAVIHAHAYNIQPFAAARKPIEPVLEATQKFGVVNLVEHFPAHSSKLAESVVAGLLGQEERMQKQAAAVLIPTHGIVVAGKDLLATLDALERIDWNCYCIIAGRMLG